MGKILDQVDYPQDLKGLSISELEILAEEIREFLIENVSASGGHLASSLGVVELTLALHYVYDLLEDQLIWDVGHQSYVHKILTGRKKGFASLRKWGGISGFPKQEESPYDHFNTGHSSTSISAALGISEALKKKNDHHKVLSVIGDGSLTGGLAFEGLNHAGGLKGDVIVVLNDNKMSISKNVGALSSYLNRIRMGSFYKRSKREINHILRKLPGVGGYLSSKLERLREKLKYLLLPGAFFEELGFQYYGPIDGHDLEQLIRGMRVVREKKGPVLLHILTKKGKGYLPAERKPDKFHGIGCFDPETGCTVQKKGKTYTESFSEALLTEAAKNENICAITAAMREGTGLGDYAQKYPERFYDVGIAEAHAVTFAAGLAAKGSIPVVAVYSTFLQRAFDQIIHDVALQNLPVIFAVDRAGVVGEDGETHQGIFDIGFLRMIPNLTIMEPKDDQEMKAMFSLAVNSGGPVVLRYPRGEMPLADVFFSPSKQKVAWGKGEIINSGKKTLVLTAGRLVYEVMAGMEKVRGDWTVVNLRFLKPLDEELLLKLAREHETIVTVEEHILAGGLGSAVGELLRKNQVWTKLYPIGIEDQFIKQGDAQVVRAHYRLDAQSIGARILEITEGK